MRAMADAQDNRRRAILTDPEILGSVRRVITRRGVPKQDVDDVLQQVLADAWVSPGLPLDDHEEARLYLGGMARFKAVDVARDGADRPQSLQDLDIEDRVVEATYVEERELVVSLLDRLTEKYPRTVSWFLRRAVDGEESSAIAADANVTPGYVRHEVADIQRTALQMAKNLCAAAAIIVLILGGARLWRSRLGESEMAMPDPDRKHAPVPLDAGALRQRAQRACDERAWEACLADLDAAKALDPAGETRDVQILRRRATDYVQTFEAPDSQQPLKPRLPH